MERYFLAFLLLFLGSCKYSDQNGNEALSAQENEYASYLLAGEPFSSNDLLSDAEMKQRYGAMNLGDTLEVAFSSTVASVCKKKGCWMELNLSDKEEVMVKFKDYSFFVPKDIEQKEVVVHGKAFIEEVSVEEQQHFAEDGGKSPQEIAAITEPKRTLSFLAEGVLIEP